MNPLFLRSQSGDIINVTGFQKIGVKSATMTALDADGKPAEQHVVTVFFPGNIIEFLSFHDSRQAAASAIDCVFARLQGDREVSVTSLPRTLKPSHRAPDPFDSDQGEDRVTHICEQPGNAYCPACEEEAFANG